MCFIFWRILHIYKEIKSAFFGGFFILKEEKEVLVGGQQFFKMKK